MSSTPLVPTDISGLFKEGAMDKEEKQEKIAELVRKIINGDTSQEVLQKLQALLVKEIPSAYVVQ